MEFTEAGDLVALAMFVLVAILWSAGTVAAALRAQAHGYSFLLFVLLGLCGTPILAFCILALLVMTQPPRSRHSR